jgi:hypothetical protein
MAVEAEWFGCKVDNRQDATKQRIKPSVGSHQVERPPHLRI